MVGASETASSHSRPDQSGSWEIDQRTTAQWGRGKRVGSEIIHGLDRPEYSRGIVLPLITRRPGLRFLMGKFPKGCFLLRIHPDDPSIGTSRLERFSESDREGLVPGKSNRTVSIA